MVNRLRSNHYNLNDDFYRVNIVDSPACPYGAEIQDINHITLQCSTYSHKSFHFKITVDLNFLDPSSFPIPLPNFADSLAFMKGSDLFFWFW